MSNFSCSKNLELTMKKPTQQWLRANRPEGATHYNPRGVMAKWCRVDGDGVSSLNPVTGIWCPSSIWPSSLVKIKPLPKHVSLPEEVREAVWGYIEGKDRKTALLEMVERAQQYDVVLERNKELTKDVSEITSAHELNKKLLSISIDKDTKNMATIDAMDGRIISMESIISRSEKENLELSRSIANHKRSNRYWQLAFWCSVAAFVFLMVSK